MSTPTGRLTALRAPVAALIVAAAALLAGCGGGGSALPSLPVPEAEPSGPGRLAGATALRSLRPSEIAAALAAGGIASPAIVPRYEVANFRLEYQTTDADGREIRASGLLSVPVKPLFARSPVLSYHHGTIFEDAEAPSNAISPDAPPIAMASLGYIVVAPDYVGYGASKGAGHPYLLSGPSAAAVIDLLAAARTWRLRNGVASNGQLFLAGYSEGGYVTIAAQRAIEAGSSVHKSELVAAVPGSGPYHVAATLDALLQAVKDESGILGALIDPGFLRHLPGTVRVEVRRALLRKLVPSDTGVFFDTRFVDAFFEDDRDKIERQSNVHDWRPERRVRFFHGRQDRTVPYISGSSTVAAMLSRGAGDVTIEDCAAVPSDHLPCVPPFFAFMARRLAERATDL